MTRTALYLLAGLILGGIIHIIVILAVPGFAEETVWMALEDVAEPNQMSLLAPVASGEPNRFALDPELIHGVCRLDLADGPGFVRGTLPNAFWSLAVYDQSGTVAYSTTNRDGIGRTLDLGVFNAAQTRLLAQQELDIAEGLLIIEARSDQLLVVVRLAPPHDAVRPRYSEAVAAIACGTMP